MQERKQVLISGVSQGIGKQLVITFLKKGYRVLGYSRKSLDEIDYIKDLPLPIKKHYNHFYGAISTLDEQISIKQLGKIDYLINNAAELIKKPADQVSKEDFHQSFEVNTIQPFLLIKFLKEADLFSFNAHVVQISSVGGVVGSKKIPGLLSYSASKAALISITESLQAEWGGALTFNALALGAVDTAMFKKAFFDSYTEISDVEMADWIFRFTVNSGQIMAGQVVQVKKYDPI
jgi:NAD(P)-dependent dehydrogenase (short-subunit alcohol dehydrogenase family)